MALTLLIKKLSLLAARILWKREGKTQLENFTVKASLNPRFKDKWFPLNDNEYADQLRKKKKYQEQNYKTSRLGNSPLFEMRRILNRLNDNAANNITNELIDRAE